MTLFLPLDCAWEFRRIDPAGTSPGAWSSVDLPHSPFVADLDGREHWFGECEYQREIVIPSDAPVGRRALYIEAAMHSAVISVDGIECGRHSGGYLPFEVDLSQVLNDSRPHTLTLRLDNRDNPDVPPGKPYADLDFCWYGGLYRGAELRCYPAQHITDPVGADVPAGGGVFVRTLSASDASAVVSVVTHLCNVGTTARKLHLEVELLQGEKVVAKASTAELVLAGASSESVSLELEVARPGLWQPSSPILHQARIKLLSPAGDLLDQRQVRFGIRRIGFSRSGGFTINGKRIRPHGTNRHQEYPYVGYAVPKAAQYRDARRLKEAGFDYVRLSHYPQSTDFLDACDELGILVMNCIPGWQFMGGELFRKACYQNARDVIRRDRNHPCVVLWELSINETEMDEAFMAQMNAIGHEEYPGDQMFTCGWQDNYDVYIHSRQHGEIHRWQNGDKALVIAEYGDWEFHASNKGFDQKTGAGVFADWSDARQRRVHGERGLRQQLTNHIIALNDTLSSPAVFDGQWSMFDYARGYDVNRAACGVMDIFRLPKFSYFFYRSQRAPGESGPAWTGGPLVHIASHWTKSSDLRLIVLSNCEEVSLSLAGELLCRKKQERTWMTQYLPQPPFVFDLPAYSSGVIEATGYINGMPVASHRVATPGAPAALKLELDTAGIFAGPNEPDVLIANAAIIDAKGALCVDSDVPLSFAIEGEASLIGPSSGSQEAGVASVVVSIPRNCTAFILRVSGNIGSGSITAESAWQRG